jgi:SAM-dependent methyltransferase
VIERRLLDATLALAPSQPATGIWRAAELGHLLRSGVLPRTGRGLDLGCGDGRIAWLVRRELGADWRLVGLDPDERELALARDLGLYEALHAAAGDAVPEPDASFDFVFSNSVLEHVPRLDRVLDEVARVLRPGGTAVLTVPTARGRLATGERSRDGYLAALDRRVAHVNLWPVELWREELERRGLVVEHASEYLTPAEARRWEAVANATGGLLVRIAGRGRPPIEVQRSLGLRRARTPRWLELAGRAFGRAAAAGLDGGAGERGGGCVLLAARRA